MGHQEALLKLLAIEPTRRDRLEELTGWASEDVEAALLVLEQRGQVTSHAACNQTAGLRLFEITEALRHRLWQRGTAMAFEIPETTEVEFFHVNVRTEFHGEEHVRAADIGIKVKGENTWLDRIKPGLREHHFCNTSTAPGQQVLKLLALPNIRHPELATKYAFAKGQRWHGYRFVFKELGIDFQDVALAMAVYEFWEGGSTEVAAMLQYNGPELADDGVYGRIAGLTTLGKGRVQIIAPKELLLITEKNWRSGRDAQEHGAAIHGAGDDSGPGFQAEAGADTEDDVLKPGTPAGALAAAVATDGNGETVWPFPDSKHEAKPARSHKRKPDTPAP